MQEIISKAEALVETLPYLQRFLGATVVIKYGGSFLDSPDPAARRRFAEDILFIQAVGMHPVVVHGGGKAVSAAMTAAGLTPRFVQGMRMTDTATMQVVERVLSQEINALIVKSITELGGQARGFSGREIFRCEKLLMRGPDGGEVDVGFVGNPTSIYGELLSSCLRQGTIAVISPTARGADGNLYNCNADVAAARAAMTLKARRLVFMSDVPGLLRDPRDAGTMIARLRAGEVEGLKIKGVIDKGMIPKVDSAMTALEAGVERVSFVDGRLPHALLLEMFPGPFPGTEVVMD